MSEIRLDLRVNGKKKTFTQDFVPFKKALDYTEQEDQLFKKYKKNKTDEQKEPSMMELTQFRANFVASLFDDQDLTGDVILNGLDTENKEVIMDIIYFRVLGYERQNEVLDDPKELEKQSV
ncbi:phage tail assembly chaperone G [Enterococcus bulliens]